MTDTKSLTELLDNVNYSYLTETDKHMAIARAERAEFIAALFVAATQSVKKAWLNIKATLVSSTTQHA